MKVKNAIEAKLQQAFDLHYLEVLNESYMHSVPPNSETHFKLVIVSPLFADMRSVARHQTVYKLLADELQNGVHALALHTYSVEEWQKRQQQAPESPACMGGNKQE